MDGDPHATPPSSLPHRCCVPSLDAEYALLGESEVLANRIRALLANSDQAVWFENGGSQQAVSPAFLAYFGTVSEAP